MLFISYSIFNEGQYAWWRSDDERVTENTKHKNKKESASLGEPVEREGNGRDKLGIGVKFGRKKYITATTTGDDSFK